MPRPHRRPHPWLLGTYLFLSLAAALLPVGCGAKPGPSNRSAAPPAKPGVAPPQQAPANALELVFTYGSEKEKWIEEVTRAFNGERHQTAGGKLIFVRALPMGSGECIDDLLAGRRQAHLTSPASAAFIELGNAESVAKTGKPLVGPTENLVLSPVVIAMWKPMAAAVFGWGNKPVGWADILELARNPRGWAAHDHGEWGAFKFGHTHPEFSNSGLSAVFAEVYAAAGKVRGLTEADVREDRVGRYVGDIERAVVHYGSSTGFFGTKLFTTGPEYLSAAVLYENMVIESYDPKYRLPFPVVAVYPREGTFWSDHPVGVVERPWVTDEHREAAKTYVRHLLDRPQQERAMAYGFRPGDVQVPLAAPLDAAHGVDPKEPKTTLEVPTVPVMGRIKQLWREKKKHAHVVLVLDTSGSMKAENRLTNAQAGAAELVAMLGDDDQLSLLPFDSTPKWALQGVALKTGRGQATQRIQSLFPAGGTALYDAIAAAHQFLLDRAETDKITAVVVLTDGEDTNSRDGSSE